MSRLLESGTSYYLGKHERLDEEEKEWREEESKQRMATIFVWRTIRVSLLEV